MKHYLVVVTLSLASAAALILAAPADAASSQWDVLPAATPAR